MFEGDQARMSFFVASALIGDVRASFFVAGAASVENLGDRRSAKCCVLQNKMSEKKAWRTDGLRMSESMSWSDHAQIILGSCSNRFSIGRINSWSFGFMLDFIFGDVGG